MSDELPSSAQRGARGLVYHLTFVWGVAGVLLLLFQLRVIKPL